MTRPLLTDRQCRLFLEDMREFGYANLSFAEVRSIADAVHEGMHSASDVIARLMCSQMDEAANMQKTRRR